MADMRNTCAPKKVVVIGAGIAGLSAALEICGFSAGGRPGVSVEILESSQRAGGVISTERKGGFVMELGPDSVFADEPTFEFFSKIGLSSHLIPAAEENRRVFISAGGKICPLPQGFFMIAPGGISEFLKSPLFSLRCKLRVLAEPFIPARRSDAGEESVTSFVRRRLGGEILEKAAAPLVAGIYSADADILGADTVLREFVEMEKNGGILRGLRRREANGSSGARYGSFRSLSGGMDGLTSAALSHLPGGCLRTGFAVSKVLKDGNRWRVVSESGESITADGVVVAAPCKAASEMLSESAAGVSALLGSVRHSSCAVVNFGYETASLPQMPAGFGLLIADAGEGEVFACSFLSAKFPLRAPEGFCVVRFFLGGDDVCAQSDDEIVLRAVRRGAEMFGALRPHLVCAVRKYPRSMPVYRVGHGGLVRSLERATESLPLLELAGAGYRGVGLPACIKSGAQAATQILRGLGAV